MTEIETAKTKKCAYCGEIKPISEFLRRTGRRSGPDSRRGACRACRKLKRNGVAVPSDHSAAPENAAAPAAPPKRKARLELPVPPPNPGGPDPSVLRPNRQGIIRMRGRTDKGRRWQQETDLQTAVTLVKEYAAVVINRNTIRRLYSNKTFRKYILNRDQHTCYFCGEYGDTIDHLVPRAKGGHTTPLNCVCACSLCNQNKADRSLDEFMNDD